MNEKMDRGVRGDQLMNINHDIVERTNSHIGKMRECIRDYKRNIRKEAEERSIR